MTNTSQLAGGDKSTHVAQEKPGSVLAPTLVSEDHRDAGTPANAFPLRTEGIRFAVVGNPATAGSKRAFPFRKASGGLGVRVTDDNPRSKDWRAMVVHCAREAYRGPLLNGAVRLTLTFVRPRPQGHFRTGKNAGRLKEGAPRYPTTKPDCTKMVRAVEDALKGVIWRDDAQVVQQHVEKIWGEPAGCIVEVTPIEPAAAG